MEWISVKDRLPEFNEKVLVRVFPKHPVMEGQLTLIDERLNIEVGNLAYKMLFDYGFRFGTVTHWMPLPEPPKN